MRDGCLRLMRHDAGLEIVRANDEMVVGRVVSVPECFATRSFVAYRC